MDLKAFYMETRSGLLAYLRGFVADQHRSEELMQTAFEHFLAEVRNDTKILSPVAFLFGIARNLALNEIRKRRTESQFRAHVIRSAPLLQLQNALGDSVTEARLQALELALGELPGEQQEVIALHLWQGLTFSSIGDALKLPTSTAFSRYQSALKTLTDQVKRTI